MENESSFIQVSTMMIDGMMGWSMGVGMLLMIVLVVLMIAALVKYLFWRT